MPKKRVTEASAAPKHARHRSKCGAAPKQVQHAIEKARHRTSAARHVVSDAPNKLGGSVDDALKNVSLLMPPKTEPNVRRWGMEKQKYKIK